MLRLNVPRLRNYASALTSDRKMYQSYGIMYPDYIYVSFPHCATNDYCYLCKKEILYGNIRGRHY